jgi:hypothetical protein
MNRSTANHGDLIEASTMPTVIFPSLKDRALVSSPRCHGGAGGSLAGLG